MGPPPRSDATPETTALSVEELEDVFFSCFFSINQLILYEIVLEAGTYAMLSFKSDSSGTPHVMLGMLEMITVR